MNLIMQNKNLSQAMSLLDQGSAIGLLVTNLCQLDQHYIEIIEGTRRWKAGMQKEKK